MIESEWLGVIRWECGFPGPLAPIWHSVIAWAITHQLSHKVKELAARCANLPTHVPAPVSIHAVSCLT